MSDPYYSRFSRFGGGSHFSGVIDFRNLGIFAEGFKEESRMAIYRLLLDGADLAHGTIYRILKGHASSNPNPVRFNYHDKYSKTTGASSSGKYSKIAGSGGDPFSKIADSITRSQELTDDTARVGLYSNPYPAGVMGTRGGKIARIYERGTGAFWTGAHQSGGGFWHEGFPALNYMAQGEAAMKEYIENNLDRVLKGLAPGGGM